MERGIQEGLPEEVTSEWRLKVDEEGVMAMPGETAFPFGAQ